MSSLLDLNQWAFVSSTLQALLGNCFKFFVCLFVVFVFNVMAKGPRQGSQVALGCGLCWTCWVVSKGRLVGIGVSARAGVRPQVTCGCGCIDSHRRTLVSTSQHLGRGSGAGLGRLENF